jgi:hypothetical protein
VTGVRGGPGTRGAPEPSGVAWFLGSPGPDRDAGDCATGGSRRAALSADSPETPAEPPAVAASGAVARPAVPLAGAVAASGALLGADGRPTAAAASRAAVPALMPGCGPGPGRALPPETPAAAGAGAAA